MSNTKYASLESQLGELPCDIEDTNKMFWLRESDDYDSRVALGNALSGQYRFKEAIESYEKALRIRQDDKMLFIRLGGANLTLFRFEAAMKNYQICQRLGMDKKALSYPLGIWHYLNGDYKEAKSLFADCLPCDDEMRIAIIYWHTLSCYRSCMNADMLNTFSSDIQVGHHVAYKKAVMVFCGEIKCEQAIKEVSEYSSDLDYIIAMYGICVYLEFIGQNTTADRYLKLILKKDAFWPCISYLTALNDYKRGL